MYIVKPLQDHLKPMRHNPEKCCREEHVLRDPAALLTQQSMTSEKLRGSGQTEQEEEKRDPIGPTTLGANSTRGRPHWGHTSQGAGLSGGRPLWGPTSLGADLSGGPPHWGLRSSGVVYVIHRYTPYTH